MKPRKLAGTFSAMWALSLEARGVSRRKRAGPLLAVQKRAPWRARSPGKMGESGEGISCRLTRPCSLGFHDVDTQRDIPLVMKSAMRIHSLCNRNSTGYPVEFRNSRAAEEKNADGSWPVLAEEGAIAPARCWSSRNGLKSSTG